ncbi:hypothetical protein [Ascidiimonas sp. W6]|uniref:hypothetical protein n=1 Tax=Ascidiimonas meishanensis TaxID=3128903 RepID=UPI0030ED917E
MKKPWDSLIANGDVPPTLEEQEFTKEKFFKGFGKTLLFSEMSLRERWGFALYQDRLVKSIDNTKRVEKSQQIFNTNTISENLSNDLEVKKTKNDHKETASLKPWDGLKANNNEQPPTLEEQRAANTKVKKNYREERPGNEGMVSRELWAYSLYKRNESVKNHKKISNFKPWLKLNGEIPPSIEEQKAASARVKDNYLKKKLPKTGLSPRELWAYNLYYNKESRKLRKKNKPPKPSVEPWYDLITKGEQPPSIEEQRIASTKSSSNYRNKNPRKYGFTPREEWALHLYDKRQREAKKASNFKVVSRNSSDCAVNDNVTVASKDVEELVNANSSDDLEGLEEMIVGFEAKESLKDTVDDNESVASKDLEDLINANPSDDLEGLKQVMDELDTNNDKVINDAFKADLGITLTPEALQTLTDLKFVDETEDLQQDIDKTATAVTEVARIPAPDNSPGLGGFINTQPTATAKARGLKRTRSDESRASTNNNLEKKPAPRKFSNRGSK